MRLAKAAFQFFFHGVLPVLMFVYGFAEGMSYAKRQPVAQFSISHTLN